MNTDCKQVQPDQFLFDSPSLLIKSPGQHIALFTVGALPPSAWPPGYSAAIFLQFKEDAGGEWRYLGAIGEGKESAFFKVQVPESIASRFEVLGISLGVSIIPTINLPQPPPLPQPKSTALVPVSSANDSLRVAKKLLDNFVNYALSYSRTFTTATDTNEAFIPAKIITDWYSNTVRKAQLDPVGFFNKIMRSED